MFFLLFLLSASICTSTKNSVRLDTHYKTGKWTIQENELVLNLYETLPKHKIWITMSETLHRRPRLIREHFIAFLDVSKWRNKREWTSYDEKVILQAVRVAQIEGTGIKWSEMSKVLKRSQVSLQSHYKSMTAQGLRYKITRLSENSCSTLDGNNESINFKPTSKIPPRRLRKPILISHATLPDQMQERKSYEGVNYMEMASKEDVILIDYPLYDS